MYGVSTFTRKIRERYIVEVFQNNYLNLMRNNFEIMCLKKIPASNSRLRTDTGGMACTPTKFSFGTIRLGSS
jgi:hypothetical protein